MLTFLFTYTPLAFFVQDFWRDEAFSYLLAKRNMFDIVRLTAQDFNPPLYYLVLHWWMKISGRSELALRSVSLLFYWMTIYVCFLFLRNVLKFSAKKSFCFLLLLISNPVLVYYAFEARMYSLLAFLTTLSFYLFFTKRWKAYTISVVLALYTNYFAVIMLLVQATIALSWPRRAAFKKILIAGAMYLPWLVFVVYTKNAYQFTSFWIQKSDLKTPLELLAVIYSGYEKSFFDFFDTKLVLFSGFLLLIFLLGWKRNRISLSLLLWSVGAPLLTALISFFLPIFLPRYLIFSTIGLVLLLSLSINRISYRPVRYGVFLALFLVTLYYQGLQITYRKKNDLRKTIREIKLLAKTNDRVYAADELDYFVMQYYFGEENVYIYGKSFDEIKQWEGKVLISPDKITRLLPLYPNKAFVIGRSRLDILSAY